MEKVQKVLQHLYYFQYYFLSNGKSSQKVTTFLLFPNKVTKFLQKLQNVIKNRKNQKLKKVRTFI